MHYTSGTTGRRKGVWSGVLAEDDARRLAAEEIELWGFGPADRHLVLSPLHHSAPLRFAIHTLLAGGEVLLPGPFDAARAAARDRRAPPDDHVLRAHPPAAAAGARHRLVLVPPPRARRRPVPRAAQAGGARGAARGQRLGVLRVHRGAVHRLLAGGLAGPPRQRGAGPPRPAAGDRRARPAVVRGAALGPVRVLAGARRRRRRPGAATGSPSATWAGWTTTASCGSTGAGRTWSSPAA